MQNRAYLFFSMSGVPSMIRGEGVRQKMEWPILGRCGFACSGYRKHEHTEHHIYCVQNQTQPAITNHSNLQNSQAFCGSFGNTFFFVHRTNYLLDQTSYLYISSYKFLKKLKADRPPTRNYPHMPDDYRHTDKPLELVVTLIALYCTRQS